jgi:signal transduction histidine kinase
MQASNIITVKILNNNNKVLKFKDLTSLNNHFSYSKNSQLHFSNLTLFCHFSISNHKTKDHVYVINCPNTIDLTVFSTYINSSTHLPTIIENKFFSFNNNYVFELPNNSSGLIIKIKTSKFVSLKLIQEKKEIVFEKRNNMNIFYGIAIGTLLLIFLYHSILYLVVRENIYLYYILQIAIASAIILLNWGILNPLQHHIYRQLIFSLFIIIYSIVFWVYLKSNTSSKIHNVLYIYTLPLFITIGLFDIYFPSFISKLILYLLNLLLIITFLFTTIKYYPKKSISYPCFLSAWIILLIGHMFFAYFDLFPNQSITFTAHFLEIGILFNIILLALAFANNLNIYKLEKNDAEILEFKALKEKEILIREQKVILEKLILERNKVLLDKIKISESQKLEIEDHKILINKRINEIEKINNELIQKNLEITNQNIELEKHHKILEETIEKRTKKLIKAKERAIIADKLKTSFLNNLTQEINIPMNAITGYSSIITDKDLSKEVRNDYLQKIIKYVDILLESVDNIVILSRIQAGIIKPRISEISLIELINNIQLIFREKIDSAAKKISFQINFEGIDPKMHITADNEKIRQISNILSDAFIKQMAEGEIKIKFRSVKSLIDNDKKKDKLIVIFVFKSTSDTQNNLIELFKNFLLNPESNLKYNNHIELGLAICKGLFKIIKAKSKIKDLEESKAELKLIFPVNIELKS